MQTMVINSVMAKIEVIFSILLVGLIETTESPSPSPRFEIMIAKNETAC
jgi:hypothetical protein